MGTVSLNTDRFGCNFGHPKLVFHARLVFQVRFREFSGKEAQNMSPTVKRTKSSCDVLPQSGLFPLVSPL